MYISKNGILNPALQADSKKRVYRKLHRKIGVNLRILILAISMDYIRRFGFFVGR